VVDNEDGSLFWIETSEPPFDLIPGVNGADGIPSIGQVDLSGVDLHQATSPALRLAIGRVDRQAVEPRIEAVGIAHRPDVQPGRRQRLLHGIRSRILVAEDQPGDSVEPLIGGGGKRDEGLVVAGDRLFDKLSSAVRHHFRAGAVALPTGS